MGDGGNESSRWAGGTVGDLGERLDDLDDEEESERRR